MSFVNNALPNVVVNDVSMWIRSLISQIFLSLRAHMALSFISVEQPVIFTWLGHISEIIIHEEAASQLVVIGSAPKSNALPRKTGAGQLATKGTD